MNPTTHALLGYIAWMIILLGTLGTFRVMVTLKGKAPNSFLPDGSDVSPFSNRLCRTHANCYEHFPIFGGLLIFAIATGATAITDPLASYFLGARVAQGVVHLLSTSVNMVRLRFALFLAQVIIAAIWVLKLAGLV